MNHIIAIDGPAASGKGTLSRALANHMNYAHMDTGALYRAVGFEVLEAGDDPADPEAAIRAARTLAKKITDTASSLDLILHNETLRKDHVGVAASRVAAIPEVREALIKLQKDFAACPGASYKGAVLDGRDIGTVICPDAPAKIFIIADDKIRAKRRTKELHLRGIEATYEAVLKDMRERDTRDHRRQTAPMTPASDAFILDTSDLNTAQVFEKALEFVLSKIIPPAIL